MYLRPDCRLKHSINLIRPEAVGVEAIKEVKDPQDPESPQVLQRINAACSQLRKQIRTLYLCFTESNKLKSVRTIKQLLP